MGPLAKRSRRGKPNSPSLAPSLAPVGNPGACYDWPAWVTCPPLMPSVACRMVGRGLVLELHSRAYQGGERSGIWAKRSQKGKDKSPPGSDLTVSLAAQYSVSRLEPYIIATPVFLHFLAHAIISCSWFSHPFPGTSIPSLLG